MTTTNNEKLVTLALLALNNELVTKYIDEGDAALKDLIDAISAKLETLEGGEEGSIEKIVADKVAEIVAGAPESFDTLKELADWISSHESDATAMNSAIQENASAIATLKEKVEALESAEPIQFEFATTDEIRALWADKNSDENKEGSEE